MVSTLRPTPLLSRAPPTLPTPTFPKHFSGISAHAPEPSVVLYSHMLKSRQASQRSLGSKAATSPLETSFPGLSPGHVLPPAHMGVAHPTPGLASLQVLDCKHVQTRGCCPELASMPEHRGSSTARGGPCAGQAAAEGGLVVGRAGGAQAGPRPGQRAPLAPHCCGSPLLWLPAGLCTHTRPPPQAGWGGGPPPRSPPLATPPKGNR